MNKQLKIIKSWGKLRHPDKEFTKTAIRYFLSLTDKEQQASLVEMQDYINDVRSGKIKPSVPKIPIRIFKGK